MDRKALETLKRIPNWVCYKSVPQPNGKDAKLPKNPRTGGNAVTTKPETWSDFMTSVRAKKRYNMDGLGFVLAEASGIIGIDLDHCIDNGSIAPWAAKIVRMIDSYTEVSPSGEGLHIFAYGKIPKALGPVPDGRIEMYSRDRYFTVTGQMLPGSFEGIANRQEAINNLWNVVSAKRAKRDKQAGFVSHPTNERTAHSVTSYAASALNREANTFSLVSKGCRNSTLNTASFRLGQFVEAGLLDRLVVETTLLNVALNIGLGDVEAQKTITSGINGGMRKPRNSWPSGLLQ